MALLAVWRVRAAGHPRQPQDTAERGLRIEILPATALIRRRWGCRLRLGFSCGLRLRGAGISAEDFDELDDEQSEALERPLPSSGEDEVDDESEDDRGNPTGRGGGVGRSEGEDEAGGEDEGEEDDEEGEIVVGSRANSRPLDVAKGKGGDVRGKRAKGVKSQRKLALRGDHPAVGDGIEDASAGDSVEMVDEDEGDADADVKIRNEELARLQQQQDDDEAMRRERTARARMDQQHRARLEQIERGDVGEFGDIADAFSEQSSEGVHVAAPLEETAPEIETAFRTMTPEDQREASEDGFARFADEPFPTKKSLVEDSGELGSGSEHDQMVDEEDIPQDIEHKTAEKYLTSASDSIGPASGAEASEKEVSDAIIPQILRQDAPVDKELAEEEDDVAAQSAEEEEGSALPTLPGFPRTPHFAGTGGKLQGGPTEEEIDQMKAKLLSPEEAQATEGSLEAINELREKLWRIGGIHHGYSYYAEALEYYDRALKLWEENVGENDDQIAIMTFAIGTVHKVLSDWEKAALNFRRSLRIKKELWGEEHPSTQLTAECLQETLDKRHDWEIRKNLYDPYNECPGAWIDLGPAELDLSESEEDPESPRFVNIP